MKPLKDRVAVVAGATRGAGRGIAVSLGEAGATVYCTGRSSRAAGSATPGRSETIDETAEMVTAAGGRGIAVRVDHLDEPQVKALFGRVRSEAGRLDVLVNDVWGGDALTQWGHPFWELDVEQGLRMLRTAIDTHLITARHAAPLLLETPGSLLVEITDGDSGFYRGNLFYDLVKSAIVRLAFAMSEELGPKGVTSLAVTPGFLRSEAMLAHFGVTEADWRDAVRKDPHFAASETPYFVGRAVASLAADPKVMRRKGRVWSSWGLAREYGFKDKDGRSPDWGEHFLKHFGQKIRTLDDGFYRYWEGYREIFAPPKQDDASPKA